MSLRVRGAVAAQVKGAGGQIVAKARAVEGGGLGDDELAGLAQARDGGGDFLRLGGGKRAVAHLHQHALDALVAAGRIQPQHHIHDGDAARGEEAARRGGAVGDGFAQVQRQHDVVRQPVAARQADDQQDGEDNREKDHGPGHGIDHPHHDGAQPGQKTDHEMSFGRMAHSNEKAWPSKGPGFR